MKQREFVVVVLRLFAIWYALYAIVHLIESLASPSIRNEPPIVLAIYAFAAIVVFVFAALIWTRSEGLMRRIYADADRWETEPIVYEDAPTLTEDPLVESQDPAFVIETEPIDNDAVFELEPASSFYEGITSRDIFLTFLMALGIWTLVQAIPGAVAYLVNLFQISDIADPQTSHILIQRGFYYAVQIVLGILLTRPGKIVSFIEKKVVERGEAPETT